MPYSVHQHWDPLKVCAVGRSYPPETYSFIENVNVRSIMERIARETEEDYQELIKLLERFGVEVVRCDIIDDPYDSTNRLLKPPMCPRDWTAMIGDSFHMLHRNQQSFWDQIKGVEWPQSCPSTIEEFNGLDAKISFELEQFNIPIKHWEQLISSFYPPFGTIEEKVRSQSNNIFYTGISSAMTTRVGKDLYFGTDTFSEDQALLLETRKKQFPDYRCHVVNSGGHIDGTLCPIVPGLVVSIKNDFDYNKLFPGWEVIQLPERDWSKIQPFIDLKRKNQGKWWVPGEEFNDDFINFVDTWLDHWVGYVEETVFDVNVLVIDEKNVVCSGYNKEVFSAFDRFGITPHIIKLRHRYFWDGGIHCITSDLHREGVRKDYFPERG
jgi:hypothetical protein